MWVLVPATLSGLWIVSITSLLSSWGLCNFNHGEYVAGAPSRIAHLDSRQTRDLASDIARLARSHRNDDVGSHDLPSTAPFDCLRSLQSRQCADASNSVRALPDPTQYFFDGPSETTVGSMYANLKLGFGIYW